MPQSSIMPPVKTIAIINQKGGVGKTTTTANLGAAVAAMGSSLCLLDLDPQCHLTLHMGFDDDSDQPNIYDVIVGEVPLADVIRPVANNLTLIPASIDLAALESELANQPGREQILRRRLAEAHLTTDFLLIDCPPSLGLLTINALAAADEVIIPLQPHFLALQGLGQLLRTVDLVHQRINPNLMVRGVVLCMFERITRLANEVVADLQNFFAEARGGPTTWSQARILETVVRRNVKLAECPSHGESIFSYDPTCNGAKDYQALAEEFIEFYQPSLEEPADAKPADAESADVEQTGSKPTDVGSPATPAPMPAIAPPTSPDDRGLPS